MGRIEDVLTLILLHVNCLVHECVQGGNGLLGRKLSLSWFVLSWVSDGPIAPAEGQQVKQVVGG